ncbi:c2H2-type domain-containing protein [Trichonephila clavata]|uniref:C2H2-type domain-containing protein n=1 Tax=Trichonephila clavata TaxID=2740835 RepID=A0A8X6LP74_TRICU|nr:c2H2-type domain-containing protein [Trichonephila clavata]
MKVNGNATVAEETKTDTKNDQIECGFCGKTYEFLDFISHSQCYQFPCTSCSAGFDFEHHLNQHSMAKHGHASSKSNSVVTVSKKSKTFSVQNQNTNDYNLRFKPMSVCDDTNKDLAASKNQHFELTELNVSAVEISKKKLFSKSNSQQRFSKSNSQKRLKVDRNSLEQNHNEVSNISDENQFSDVIKTSIRSRILEIKKETRNTLKKKSISDHSCSRTTFEELPCNSKRKKPINTRKNAIPDDFCSKTTNEELGCSSLKKEIRNTRKNSIPDGFCSTTTNMELECSSTKKETRSSRKYSIPDDFCSKTTNEELGCSSLKKEIRNTLKNSIPDGFCSTTTNMELECSSTKKETRSSRKYSIPDDFCSKTTNEELGCSSLKKDIRNTLKNTIPDDFCSKTTNEELGCSSLKKEIRNTLKNSIPGGFCSKTTNMELECSLTKKRTRNALKNTIPGNFSSKTTVKELPCSSGQRETRNTLRNSVPDVFGSTNTVEELPHSSRQRETRNTLKISIQDDFCSKTTNEELPHNSTTKETKNNLNKNLNLEDINSKSCNKESCYSTKPSTSDKSILNGLCKNRLIKRNRKCKISAKQKCISNPKNPCVPISKKDIKNSKLRAPVEKIKKASTQEDQRYSMKGNQNHSLKKAKYDDLPPGNPLTDKVDIRLLLKSIQDEDTGILLQKQNNVDTNVKCSKCGKSFRTIKQASIHYSSCKSPKCKITSVPVNEVRWVCILCHNDYSHNIQLVQHKKFCKILMKKDYGSAYESCPKCNYNYISEYSLLQHKCDEHVKDLNACTVQLQKLPSFTGPLHRRIELYECLDCGKMYTSKYSCMEHLKVDHHIPGFDMEVKPLYINLDKHFSTTVIKSEGDILDDTEFVKDSSTSQTSSFQESRSSGVNDNVATNPLASIYCALNSASFSLPQPSMNLPPNQPSTNLNSAQLFNPFAFLNTPGTANPATNIDLNLLCEKFCNCPKVKTNSEGEKKTCVKCMNKIIDFSRLTSILCSTSFNTHNIKKERNERDQGTSAENLFDWSALFGSSTESDNKNLDMYGDATRFLSMQLFDVMRTANLTPPTSFLAFTPPTTPETLLVQSSANEATLPNEELCTSSDAAGCYSGNVVPDITQLLGGQQSPSALLTLIDEPNGLETISEEFCCSQEQSETPLPLYNITFEWNTNKMDKLDAWAIVTSPDDKEVELYFCAHCLLALFKDQNSLARHLYTDHDKQGDIFVSYMHKQDYHNNTK